MGKLKTPHCHGFRIFGRVHDFQNQLLLFLWAPRYYNKHTRTNPNSGFQMQYSRKSQNIGDRTHQFVWERWGPTNHEDTSYKFLKLLTMGSISSGR